MKYSIYVHSPQKKYPHNQNRHKSFLPVPLRVRGHRKQLNRWKCHPLTHSVTFQYFGSGCNRVNQEVPGCKPYVTEVWQQRWANSVLMTEYEYEYYLVSQKWPNTNTNIIRFPKNDRIQIRILFGLPKMTEYEYEYFSATQKWLIANTNIILLPNNDWIQISFGFPKRTKYEYEYYSATQKWPQTNTNIIRFTKNDQIQIRILLDSLKTQIIFFCISTTMQYQRSIHSF